MNIKRSDEEIIGSDDSKPSSEFDAATFDDYAKFYESFATVPYRQELETPTIGHYLGDLKGKRVLDFGCGPGFFTRWLRDKGAEVVGYDISKGMINYARQQEEKDSQNITYIDHLDSSLAGTFDIVLAIYVMPYIATQKDLLSLCRTFSALLKLNGKLITLPLHPDFNQDIEYYRPYGFSLQETEPRKDGVVIQLHLYHQPDDIDLQTYYWSKETLEDTLSQAGFVNISWRDLLGPHNHVPHNIQEYLLPYQRQPHVAIIECQIEIK